MTNNDIPNEDIEEPNPEDFLPAPPKKKGFLQRMPNLHSVNPALFLFLLFVLLSFLSWTDGYENSFWVSQDSIFVKKEYWRVLTSLFVHANGMHLLDNSLLFMIFGSLLYFFYGGFVFPFVTLLMGIATMYTSVCFHEPQIRLLGASGMIYGMVGMWIVLYIKYDILYSIHLRFLRAIGFSLVMLFPTSFHIEVDYMAHGIGFAYGLVTGIFLIPFLNKRVERFYLTQQ